MNNLDIMWKNVNESNFPWEKTASHFSHDLQLYNPNN